MAPQSNTPDYETIKGSDHTPRVVKLGDPVRHDIGDDPNTYTAANGTDDCGPGNWFCATHQEHFQNNMMAQSHWTNDCVAVWWCFEHGPEVP